MLRRLHREQAGTQMCMATMDSSTLPSEFVFYPARLLPSLNFLQTPLRIPTALALFKAALPQVFPGLAVGDDLSDRPGVGSASTLYTIWYDPTTGTNRRSSAADGYLWAPSQQRASLTVLATHKVNKVLFGKDTSAQGVSFVPTDSSSSSTKAFDAYASKGVILSAGSLASAPILERSGVGNPEMLKRAGVKCLVDLPGVGANLNASHLGTSCRRLVWADFWDRTSQELRRTLSCRLCIKMTAPSLTKAVSSLPKSLSSTWRSSGP